MLELVGLSQPPHAGDARQGHVRQGYIDLGALAGPLSPEQRARHGGGGQHAGNEVPAGKTWLTGTEASAGPVIRGTPTSALIE